MRRLLVALVVLLGLLLVADRAAAAFASRAIATQVASSTALSSEPEVDVTGFPFLTQALSGRYGRVEVSATDVPAGELTLGRLDATLVDVEVPLADALSGSVTEVPVGSVRAIALVGWAELARRSGERQLAVAPAGDKVRVTGSVQVLGQTVSASAVSRVEVVDGDLLVTAEAYDVGDAAANDLLTRALGGRLDLRIPVTGLPYGLTVTGVQVLPEGLSVRAAAGATVLTAG